MKRLFLFFIYAILVIAVESVFSFPGDLLLIAVIFFGFYETWSTGLFWTLLFGYLLDVASASPMGTAIFSYAATFGLIRFLRSKVLFKDWHSILIWVAILTLWNGLLSWSYLALLGPEEPPFGLYGIWFLIQMSINAFFALFWVPLLQWYQSLTLSQLMESKDPLLGR